MKWEAIEHKEMNERLLFAIPSKDVPNTLLRADSNKDTRSIFSFT